MNIRLIFKSLFAHLGMSMSENLDLNFMVTPRKSGDQVGVIANQINPESQTSQLVNIEYNQLSTVLESSDDLSSGNINDPKTGYSPYPGNMNQFIRYVLLLEHGAEDVHNSVYF